MSGKQKFLKGKSGQKKRAAPARPFKNGFALEVPNPDYDFLSMEIAPDETARELYSEEYLSMMPDVDHAPRPYQEILEEAANSKWFDPDVGITEIYVWMGQLSGLIKIGHSIDTRRRLIQSQSGSGETLFEFFIMDGCRAIEKIIHKEMAPFRHHGEWYYPTRQVLKWLNEAEGWGGY